MPQYQAKITARQMSDRQEEDIFIEASDQEEANRIATHEALKRFPTTDENKQPLYTFHTAHLVRGKGVGVEAEAEDESNEPQVVEGQILVKPRF